jgi:hypothetical protein
MVECAWQSTGCHGIAYGILNGFVVVSRFGGTAGVPGRAPGGSGRPVVSNGLPMLNGECTVHS